ncbi:MAG: [citrate (pro-3S)-lyase] ligase [Lachnospiraceae bacterium]|nr:[citrate (pro-3S)-lyase] ligase [Lachnospiraceae bacterium]
MILEGKPLKGRELERLKEFLKSVELDYDDGIEYSICILNENSEIVGTGSVEENVLKCIAVDPAHRGEGIAASIMSHLIQYEFERGRPHLFIYTKPKNIEMFEDLSFYSILKTEDILFMENRKSGISGYLNDILAECPKEALDPKKKIGAIVANCNPFTLGHRFLIEQAAMECDYVHLFVLSDKRSEIPAKERYELVLRGTKDIPNIILHKTSDYLISSATFPTYFLKEKNKARKANCKLDIMLFSEVIAPRLNIKYRYVGNEPDCRITGEYNSCLHEELPRYGIHLIEIPRKKYKDQIISASKVRELIKEKNYDLVRSLVPESTFSYIMQ